MNGLLERDSAPRACPWSFIPNEVPKNMTKFLKPKLIVIVGQTATGKSALAIDLAKKFQGEIVSADSRQVYRGLDIGTGKISRREMQGVPHHLLDVANPKKVFTIHDYMVLAEQAIADILKRKHVPCIVGGTGFYVEAIVDGTIFPSVKPNHALRKRLGQESLEKLWKRLCELDPDRAKTIDPHNKRRLIRAIEIAETLGTVPRVKKVKKYDPLFIGLIEKNLPEKIKSRLKKRLAQGLIREMKRLHTSGLSYRRMDALGLEYRFGARYLQKKLTYKEFVENLERAIVKYAKRQKTWFTRDKRIHWFDPTCDKKRIMALVQEFLADGKS